MGEPSRFEPAAVHAQAVAAGPRRLGAALLASAPAALQVVLLLVPTIWAARHFFPPINHDVALILDVSRRWLDGARLYVDVIDVNPPLIFVLSALPEIAARATGLVDAPTAFIGMVLGLIAAALLLARRLLATLGELFGPVASFTMLPAIAFLLLVYPGDMFGQREHLMLAAVMPYLLAASGRAAGILLPPHLLGLAALLAGFGFALKPHFLLGPVLIEAWLLWRRHGQGHEIAVWPLGLGPVAHALVMGLVTPAYLTDVVPMALRQYAEQGNAMWDVATGDVIGPTILAWAALAGIAALWPALRWQKTFGLFALAGLAAAVVQGKGWPYQSLPATAVCILLAIGTLATLADAWAARSRRQGGVVVLAGLLLLACCYNSAMLERAFRAQRNFANSDAKRLLDIVRLYAADRRVLIISPGVQPHFPMANYAGIQLVGRFESMWVLQSLYWDCHRPALYSKPWRMTADERLIFDGLSAEFARVRPSLVIIDRDAGVPVCGDVAFDYLEYFGRNPDFAATLAGYEELAGFGRYMIFRRNDGEADEVATRSDNRSE